jgi:hypothetical protein
LNESRALNNDEKLALATKIMGQMELAGAREKDGYDSTLICPGFNIYFFGTLD